MKTEQIIKVVQKLLKSHAALMPGLKHIAIQDYALPNDAVLAAEKMLDELKADVDDTVELSIMTPAGKVTVRGPWTRGVRWVMQQLAAQGYGDPPPERWDSMTRWLQTGERT